MSMIAICDGCGEQRAAACHGGNWFKPHDWYERTPLDEHGRQERTVTACSRRCIDLAEDKRVSAGKNPMRVILPV
jgi:hypothetical protein